VRVGVWYCGVRVASGLNDCQLDCDVVVPRDPNDPPGGAEHGTTGRSRIFEKIRKRRRNPDHARYLDHLDQPFNLVERVEERWPGTRRRLAHPLWEVIGPKPPSLARAQEIIADLLGRNKLRRMGFLASRVYLELAQHAASKGAALPDGNEEFIRSCVKEASLDGMALLAALCWEATILDGSTTASHLQSAFGEAAERFEAKRDLAYVPGLRESFRQVVEDFFGSFLPNNGRNIPNITHFSRIVPDNEKSRDLEESLDATGKAHMQGWVDRLLERYDASKKAPDDAPEDKPLD
jgi:hypothetical protein